MPAYDYQCQDCGNEFTLRLSISAYSAGTSARCPACASARTARRLGVVNVLGSSGGGCTRDDGCGTSGFT